MMRTHRPVPLLASTIPNLKSIGFIVYFFINILKIYANCRISIVLELIIDQSPQD